MADNLTDNIPYNPLFTTMYTEQLIAPLFSIAINRDTSGPSGYLALGGTPPVEFNQSFAVTPIQVLQVSQPGIPLTSSFTFYTITPDAYIYSASGNTSK